MKKEKWSFVIPCYGSYGTIGGVLDEICDTMRNGPDYEIICVDDCSPDQVGKVLDNLSINMEQLKVIHFSRNFGQHAALMAGYRVVTGDIIISLDDDGQTPASECRKLVAALTEDVDVAYAAYGSKKQSVFKNFGSAVNSQMLKVLLKKPPELEMNSYYACRRYVIDEIVRYQGAYPYLGGLLLRTTQKMANVPLEHRKRKQGNTGYTFKKLLALWMNGFTAFSLLPLRIATYSGMVFSVVGFVAALATFIRKLFNPAIQAGWSSTMAAILFVGGVLMLIMGMLGEYMGRIYITLNQSPQYVIRNTVHIEKEADE